MKEKEYEYTYDIGFVFSCDTKKVLFIASETRICGEVSLEFEQCDEGFRAIVDSDLLSKLPQDEDIRFWYSFESSPKGHEFDFN